jgi:hypothetical protein
MNWSVTEINLLNICLQYINPDTEAW